ncbi:Calcipressin, partial [Rickenella mellea]
STSTVPRTTNTIIVASVPADWFHPRVLDALRKYFEVQGELYAWAPIRAFGRIVAVYYENEDAECAKQAYDHLTIEAPPGHIRTTLRVYRADPTPITHPTSPSEETDDFSPFHLRPPAIERNFLISPPGSPPVGWEPIKEDPPNATPLAEDLITALRRLQVSRSGISVLLEPEEAGVGVYVQDCDDERDGKNQSVEDDEDAWRRSRSRDGAHEETWIYGEIPKQQERYIPTRTARPPMPMTA